MRTAPALRLWTCLADSSDRTPRNQFVLVVTPHVHSSPPGQRSSNCFNQSISLDVLLSPLLQDIRLAPADRIEDLSQMLLVEVIGTSPLVGCTSFLVPNWVWSLNILRWVQELAARAFPYIYVPAEMATESNRSSSDVHLPCFI